MRRAYCAMYSGEERYILRPSTRIGRPALGMALIGLEETASIRSMVSRAAFGPTEQLRPITSTAHESISRVKVSGSAPPGRWPKSSMVTWAMIGTASPIESRAANTAWRSSSRLPKVSKISTSTPASTSASTCSRKAARASANDVGPSGSMHTPSGPTAPATKAVSCAASRASRTPARLISFNFSAIPKAARRTRLAPNVFVSRISAPDVVAGQLSNRTCENCCTYNMLKLTRLLHFHQPQRIDLLDHYERALFNQMLGEQDPDSPHGFNIYYTGLSPGAFKQQPSFMGTNPNVYSTNYTNFSCDHATGMETQAKFADTIYSRDEKGIFVNLFIPSVVTWGDGAMTIRQTTRFPDEPRTRITVAAGQATVALRVRIPSWVAGRAQAWLNGARLEKPSAPGSWLVIERDWRTGDSLEVS